MDKNKRTKVMAGALACVLGFQFVRPDQKIMAPITDARNKYASTEAQLDKANEKNVEVMRAEVNVERAQAISLPPSKTDAMRVYQKWITNLTEQCNFASPIVSPGQPTDLKGKFLTVGVKVESEVELEDFSRFMFLFDQANLKHRIKNLNIKTTGNGSSRMEVSFTAEGMSVAGAAHHDDVFPLTTLNTELTADATELEVEASEEFPKEVPFLVQVGREMVEVTEATENKWKITRALQGTEAVSHEPDEYVQLFPIRFQKQPAQFSDYENFIASSPFRKPVVPRKLNPQIAGLSDQTIAPGETVSLKVTTSDVDAEVGEITFTLEDAAPGMSLVPSTGEFKWETTDETEVTTYSPKIVVTQQNNDGLNLSKTFKVTLKIPNNAPTLEVASEAVVVLGQDFELGLKAEDDVDTEDLKFSLEGTVPEGLSIDGSTRKLTWIPAKSFAPGDYDVTVKVTDSGDPAMSATESVKLKVQDDKAVYLKLTGSVSLDNKPVALFRNLLSPENPKLKIGDKLEASEISATVHEIHGRYILIKDNQGIWKINLGDTLRDRQLIEPAEQVAEVTVKDDSEEDQPKTSQETSAETPDKTAETEPADEKSDSQATVKTSGETTEEASVESEAGN